MNNTWDYVPLLEPYQQCFSRKGQLSLKPEHDRFVLGISLAAGAIAAFAANFLLVATIAYDLKYFLKSTRIFLLILNASVCHCVYLPSHFMVSLPAIFSNDPIFSDGLMQLLSFPHTFGYYAVLLSNFAISLDRFLIMNYKHLYARWMTVIDALLVVGIWSFSFGMVGAYYFADCHKRFNQWSLTFTYSCNSGCLEPTIFGFTYQSYLSYFGQALCGVILVLYIAVFAKLYNRWSLQSGDNRRFKKDFCLLVQFFVIFFAQWVTCTTMMVFPIYFGTSLTGAFLSNFGGVSNAFVNGALLLVLNQTVKNRLFFRAQSSSLFTVSRINAATKSGRANTSSVMPSGTFKS